MQSNRKSATQQSGTFDQVPTILPYPKFLPFESTPSIYNLFCYVIKHYGTDGLSVLIYRQPETDSIAVLFGDWKGNNIDIETDNPTQIVDIANKFIEYDLVKFINLMHSINIKQAQFFFAVDDNGLVLVDMQVSLNKFVGPGMIRDIFGNIYRTQEIKKIEVIDERAIEYINKGTGSYEGDIILKPSKFKMHHDQVLNSYQPLYVDVKR